MKEIVTPISVEEECMLRNSYLCSSNTHIPSYGLWRDNDIYKESLQTRIMWWITRKNFNDENSNLVVRNFIIMTVKRLLHVNTVSRIATLE